MSKYRSNYSGRRLGWHHPSRGRRLGWHHPPGTFVTSCSHCNSKNNVPINGGPDLFKCQKCTKTMLIKNKCHCGVTSYVSDMALCCHRCQQRSCRKCVDCKERFFASGYEKRCPECYTKYNTRSCTRCKKDFVNKPDLSIFDSFCKTCCRVKTCVYCDTIFNAVSHNSDPQCGRCKDQIKYLQKPDSPPEKFYQKTQLVVEYNAFTYISTKSISYTSSEIINIIPPIPGTNAHK